MSIPQEATEINNITDDMVAGCPTIKEVLPSLEKFIGKSNLLGHNLKFDLRFLYKYGYDFSKEKRKYYDTLEIARTKLKKFNRYKYYNSDSYYDWDVYDYKLDTLCEYYNISRNVSHRGFLAFQKFYYL